MKIKIIYRIIYTLFFLQINIANAIDIQPGEIVPPKAGKNIFLVYQQQSDRGDRYINGDKQVGNPHITSTQTQARLGHAFEISDMPAFAYGQTGIASIQPGGSLSSLQSSSGVTDTAMAFVLWPYANREIGSYFAAAAYLIAPTGDYVNSRLLNIGENRYRTALQTGFQIQLIEGLHWMAIIDSTWFQNNNDFGSTHKVREQQALYSAQTSLQYDFGSTYSISSSYFYTIGGITSENGISNNDETKTQRYLVSGSATYSFGRLAIQYGRDLKTENGYFEDQRWALRYSMAF
jgi:hypothetical protein